MPSQSQSNCKNYISIILIKVFKKYFNEIFIFNTIIHFFLYEKNLTENAQFLFKIRRKKENLSKALIIIVNIIIFFFHSYFHSQKIYQNEKIFHKFLFVSLK